MFKYKKITLAINTLVAAFAANSFAASVPDVQGDPLYSNAGKNKKPAVVLAVSVEYPTAGAAYSSTNSLNKELLSEKNKERFHGYFDNNACYEYVQTIEHGATGGWTSKHNQVDGSFAEFGDGYFRYTRPAETQNGYVGLCSGEYEWSGNVMNFLTMSALDIFRQTLTGGNRAKGVGSAINNYTDADTDSSTYLRRAMLWSGEQNTNKFLSSRNQVMATFKNRTLDSSITGDKDFLNKLLPHSVAKKIEETGAKGLNFTSEGTGFHLTLQGVAEEIPNTAVSATGVKEKSAKWFNVVVEYQKDGKKDVKPTGILQEKASAGMRVAAMGYMTGKDSGEEPADGDKVDGGVLRAKMKNVGGYGKYGDAAEWDDKGRFILNPDSASGLANSGVINYLNKFGDAAPYDAKDPVAELYYTAVRYLRNGAWADDGEEPIVRGELPYELPATITPTMQDNFPIYQTWEDPLNPKGNLKTAACFVPTIITIGDSNTWADGNLPNFTANGNSNTLTDNVASGKDDKTSYQEIAEFQGSVFQWYQNGGAIGTDRSPIYGMAGMAYWVHTNDVRPDISALSGEKMFINNFFIDVLEDNYTKIWTDSGDKGGIYNKNAAGDGTQIANPYYLAGKFGGFTFDPEKGSALEQLQNRKSWTDDKVGKSSFDRYTDGMPRNFGLANNPNAMIDSLQKAFVDIENTSVKYASQSADTLNLRAPITPSNTLDLTKTCSKTKKFVPLENLPAEEKTKFDKYEPQYVCADDDHLIWNSNFNLAKNYGTIRGIYLDLSRYSSSAAGKDSEGNDIAGTLDYQKIKDQMTENHTTYPFLETLAWDSGDKLDVYHDEKAYKERAGHIFTAKGQFSAGDLTSDAIEGVKAQDLYEYILGNPAKEASNIKEDDDSVALRDRTVSILGTIVNSPVTGIFQVDEKSVFPYHYIKSQYAEKTAQTCQFANNAKTRGNYYGVAANDGIYHIFDVNGNERYGYIPTAVLPNIHKNAINHKQHTYLNDGFSLYFDYCEGGQAKSVVIGSAGRGAKSVYAFDVTSDNFDANTNTWELNDANLGYLTSSPVQAITLDGDKLTSRVVFSSGYHSETGLGSLYYLNPLTGKGTRIALGSDGVGEPFVYDEDGDGVADKLYVGDFDGNIWRVDLWNIDSEGNKKLKSEGSLKAEKLFAAGSDAQPVTGAPYAEKVQGKTIVVFGTGHYLDKSGVASDVQNYVYGIVDNGSDVVTDDKITQRTLGDKTRLSGTEENGGGRNLYNLENPNVDSSGKVISELASIGAVDASGKITANGWRLALDKGRSVAANAQILSGKYGKYAYFVGVKNDAANVEEDECEFKSGSTALISIDLLTGGAIPQVFDTNMDMTVNGEDKTGVMYEIENTVTPVAGLSEIVVSDGDGNVSTVYYTRMTDENGVPQHIFLDRRKGGIFIRTSLREIKIN
ncbi:MAG: hypothetical protein IJ566_03265 [Cardiobacteriaceae bacterium]|nr:hypothetical protein [Cardiobacteriaceae bacterium]